MADKKGLGALGDAFQQAREQPLDRPVETKRSGKRFNPAYHQRSVVIKKELSRRLDLQLTLQERELSAVVEEALEEWLQNHSMRVQDRDP